MEPESTTATATKVAPSNGTLGHFESCETCGAPLDHKQRYCVNCATRRSDPFNPATRYFAASSRRARTSTMRRPSQPGSPARAAAVVFMILLPACVGVGILVGRASSDGGGDDAALLAALDKQAAAGATASAAGSDTSGGATASISSDFSLEKGFAVQLDTLSSDSDESAVSDAKDEAEGNGAEDVGIIVPADFEITPDPGGDLVLYSGEFKSKGDAEAALKKLEGDFSDAKVIEVSAVTTGGGGTPNPSDGAGGKTVAKTDYGDVHQVEGIEPTEADKDEGTAIAEDQANQTGESYIDGQKGLPDVIAVGEAP